MTSPDSGAHVSSFRDPSGFLFYRGGELYRQVNVSYREDYDELMGSGLYDRLVGEGLLVRHEEVEGVEGMSGGAYKVIRPERVNFISYPYEWCFSQLKDAALATAAVQKRAMEYGMSLKDSSAYNIQFAGGKPVLIDTLSFERYREGEPWVAYRQFCQHFLAPLALMAYRDVRLGQLMRVYIDGVPLDLAGRLLPMRTRLSPGLYMHIHLHGKYQQRYADSGEKPVRREMGKMAYLGLADSLESAVRKLEWKAGGTEWGDYYEKTNYDEGSFAEKERLVGEFVEAAGGETVWDLGANTGRFSRIAAAQGRQTVAFDIDPAAVERNYLACRRGGEERILPLLMDLTNPSPGIGWEGSERESFMERGPTDTVLALALVHHLAISNNVPLARCAKFFAGICESLVIEYVPKSDSQVRRLLATREDIFEDYRQEIFEEEFGVHFRIEMSEGISGCERRLYLMRKRGELA